MPYSGNLCGLRSAKDGVHAEEREVQINDDLLKNDVPANGQVTENGCISLCLQENANLKVLFLGNSITRYGVAEAIGWRGDWGMAASAQANDYVHTLVRRLQTDGKIVSYCTANLSEWEQSWNDALLPEKYAAARTFAADIVVVRLGENAGLLDRAEAFMPHYRRLIEFFAAPGARVVVTDLFGEYAPFDTAVKTLAAQKGYAFAQLHDLGARDDMKAVGKFAHAGVAAHPGDAGMAAIADRIYRALQDRGGDEKADERGGDVVGR